jgi:hypothetical protein
LPSSTISDLIGERAETRSSQPEWDTVRLFVLACGVPETELERWWAAWKRAVAPDKPAWQKERQALVAENAQLKTDLAATEARASQLATDLAAAQARIEQLTTPEPAAADTPVDQPAVKEMEPLERLRIQADTRHEAQDYAGAADLYKQIVAQVEREHGPTDLRTLQAQRRLLEIETEAYTGEWLGEERKFNMWFRLVTRRKLNARWRHLIRAYQQHLSEGDRRTLELRLAHIYWGAVLLLEHTYWSAIPSEERNKRATAMLPAARKLLIGLHADCKIYLPGDPFTAQVAEYVDSPGKLIHSYPNDDQ